MRNRPNRLAGQSPEGKAFGDECQGAIAKLAEPSKKLYVAQCFLAFREWAAVVSSSGCDHQRYAKQAIRRGTVVAWSSTPTSYPTVPLPESQRSCAAALCVRDSLSRRLIMSRPSTVESSSGAAAAIMVACARSGSLCGGTTSRTIRLRSSPSTSTVFGGWSRYPSSRTAWPPVASSVGAFAQSLSLYTTRSMARAAPRAPRADREALWSGHHCAATMPHRHTRCGAPWVSAATAACVRAVWGVGPHRFGSVVSSW